VFVYFNPQSKILDMEPKEQQLEKSQKSIRIKVPSALKHQIDIQRKKTGETLGKFIERAVADLLEARQKQTKLHARQKLVNQHLHDIANDLRRVVRKIDKVTSEQVPDVSKTSKVVLIGKKQPWYHHPQKKKLFQMVKDMHRVGANLTMIASALNLEGLQSITEDGRWKAVDVEKIVAEIKKEHDYLPPLFSLPE
jgi:hypothetical protein